MSIRQLSVFLENRPGTLLEVTETLQAANINIRALSLAETPDYGILRLIVDRSEEACEAIRATGKTVKINHVIAIRIGNTPGGLVSVLQALKEHGFSVEYIYAFVAEGNDSAEVAIRTANDRDKAEELLRSLGFDFV